MADNKLLYDDVFGLTGIQTPDGTWRFYQKSGMLSFKKHSGGWEFQNERPSNEVNDRFSIFYKATFPYNPDTQRILFYGDDAWDIHGNKNPVRMYYFYFGNPVADGDYPKGTLSDRFLDEVKGTDAYVVKLVLENNEPKWIPITLRPEDVLYLRTGRRRINAERAAVYGAFAPRGPIFRRGGARKTKARRSVKKRRTARR